MISSVKKAYLHLIDFLDWDLDPLALNRLLTICLVLGKFKPAVLWTFNSGMGKDRLQYVNLILNKLKSRLSPEEFPVEWVQGDLTWRIGKNKKNWKHTNGTLIWHKDYDKQIKPLVKQPSFKEDMFRDDLLMGKLLGYPCAGELTGYHGYMFTAVTWDQDLLQLMKNIHDERCGDEQCQWRPHDYTNLFNFNCEKESHASAKMLARKLQDFYDEHDLNVIVYPDYKNEPYVAP